MSAGTCDHDFTYSVVTLGYEAIALCTCTLCGVWGVGYEAGNDSRRHRPI